ncbi:uncharacterized protein DS421_14g468630 [Arachis hypogaea]|nr:uncharacterized protein DS421_14g468630 [Arachis hypogaea]
MDRVGKSYNIGKGNLLSASGREVLIKTIAIVLISLSCFKLPAETLQMKFKE